MSSFPCWFELLVHIKQPGTVGRCLEYADSSEWATEQAIRARLEDVRGRRAGRPDDRDERCCDGGYTTRAPLQPTRPVSAKSPRSNAVSTVFSMSSHHSTIMTQCHLLGVPEPGVGRQWQLEDVVRFLWAPQVSMSDVSDLGNVWEQLT